MCGQRRGRLIADAQHPIKPAQPQRSGNGPVRRTGEVQPGHVLGRATVRVQQRLETHRAEELHTREVDDDVLVFLHTPAHLPAQRVHGEQIEITGDPQEHHTGVRDLHLDPQDVIDTVHDSHPWPTGALPDRAVGRRREEQHDTHDGEPEQALDQGAHHREGDPHEQEQDDDADHDGLSSVRSDAFEVSRPAQRFAQNVHGTNSARVSTAVPHTPG